MNLEMKRIDDLWVQVKSDEIQYTKGKYKSKVFILIYNLVSNVSQNV